LKSRNGTWLNGTRIFHSILRNADGSWAFRNTRFYPAYPGYDWGILAGWAWGASRVADYLETDSAIDRAKRIFGAEHANVQTHAGAQANMAVFMAVLQPGDTVLGMSLAHGGHLTHGTKVSFSGKLYNAVAYRTKSLSSCILAHGLTNLSLGLWIVATKEWGFW